MKWVRLWISLLLPRVKIDQHFALDHSVSRCQCDFAKFDPCTNIVAPMILRISAYQVPSGIFDVQDSSFNSRIITNYELRAQLLILRFALNSSWDGFVTTNKLRVANRDTNLINFGRTKMYILDKIVVLSNYEQRMKISNYIWKQTVWTLFFLFYPLNTWTGYRSSINQVWRLRSSTCCLTMEKKSNCKKGLKAVSL